MKTNELSLMGFEEMSSKEMRAVDGGCFLLIALGCALLAGAIAGYIEGRKNQQAS